jgi:pimeloyl-ACP methyl ester carboxylesterase
VYPQIRKTIAVYPQLSRRTTHAYGTPENLLVYDRWGRCGRPVVMLHGEGYDRSMWWPVAADLGEGCSAVAVDLPGHGQSAARDDFELGSFVHDLAMLISRLDLRRAPILVGHAGSALLAEVFAARYATRAVVAVDEALVAGPGDLDLEAIPEPYRQFAVRRTDVDPRRVCRSWVAHLPARRHAVSTARLHLGTVSRTHGAGECLPLLRDPAGFADLLRSLH